MANDTAEADVSLMKEYDKMSVNNKKTGAIISLNSQMFQIVILKLLHKSKAT